MRAACAMPPGKSSSGMSDPCLTGRWWNHNSQHHPNAAWEEKQLSLLWPKSRPEPGKMLRASQERSSKERMELSRWKRISRKLNPKVIPIGSFEEPGPAPGATQSWSQPLPALRFPSLPRGASLPGPDCPRANTTRKGVVLGVLGSVYSQLWWAVTCKDCSHLSGEVYWCPLGWGEFAPNPYLLHQF